jgi:lysophospholipase L1-like esterase
MNDAIAVETTPHPHVTGMSPGKKTFLWALLLLGVLGVSEAGAALVYYYRLSVQEREAVELAINLRPGAPNTVVRYVSHPYFDFVANPGFTYENDYRPHNALGFRGSNCCTVKVPGHIRIVAIGGSTTYGAYFTYEKNVWPALLQDKLRQKYGERIEVINTGVPYYTTYEILGLTAMILPELAPDVVLIHTGLNDAFTVGYPDEGGPDNRHFRHAWNFIPLSENVKRGMRTSYLMRVLGGYYASSNGFLPGDMAGAIQYPIPDKSEMTKNVEAASGKYFRRNLQTLVTLCRSMGAVPVLLNEPLNPAKETGLDDYHQAVVSAVSRNNSIMRDVAAKNQLLTVDLYSQMREPTYFLDAAHETKAGMEKKAVVVAEGLAAEIDLLLSSTRSK